MNPVKVFAYFSILALTLGLASASFAVEPANAQIEVKQNPTYGQYLTDANGHSLYMFMRDQQQNSTCYDACAQAWPPVLTKGAPVAGSGVVSDKLLGTVQRRDGSLQATYNGWPLYYFHQDKQPGHTYGQDVFGFGAEWYLMSPTGEIIHDDD